MTLNLSNRNLRFLPTIPDTIEYLDCSCNDIQVITQLPAGLKVLNCDNNRLETLPILPDSLEVLRVGFNQLSNLDLSNCKNLHSLSIMGNKFTDIPELPDSVRVLYLNFNNIKVIDGLNSNLLELEAHNCNLEYIITLPESLMILQCDNNYIKRLPVLPHNLRVISCSYNALQFLPPLPPNIQSVSCIGNTLSILPALPDSVEVLICDNNRISQLPELPERLTNISFRNNPVYNNERFLHEYGVAEQSEETEIPGLVQKYKVHKTVEKIPDIDLGTAFDFINLEDVNIRDYLKEDDKNMIIVIGNAKYACNRDELFTYLNTPNVRFVFETNIFFKLPWSHIIYYSEAMLFNILDFKIFEVVASPYKIKRNGQENTFYNIEPCKIADFMEVSEEISVRQK